MKKISTLIIPFLLLAYSGITYSAEGKAHYPGIFLGATDTSDETEFTYGIEYEYKWNKSWGAGFVYERLDDAKKGDGIEIFLASAFYHPNKNWRLGLGFGREEIGGKKPKDKDIFRVSAAYEIYVQDFVVAPTVAVDFIQGGSEAYVAGVAFIYPF